MSFETVSRGKDLARRPNLKEAAGGRVFSYVRSVSQLCADPLPSRDLQPPAEPLIDEDEDRSPR